MRVLPPLKAPPSRRGALGRWHRAPSRPPTTSAWTLPSREKSSSLCDVRASFLRRHRDGERQPDSSLDGKISLGSNFSIGAQISAEFSKPQILLPDREFESRLVRHLVQCFSREISIELNWLRQIDDLHSRRRYLVGERAHAVDPDLDRVTLDQRGRWRSCEPTVWSSPHTGGGGVRRSRTIGGVLDRRAVGS
jgi:hypothetical protein